MKVESIRKEHEFRQSNLVKTSLLVKGMALLLLMFIIPLQELMNKPLMDWGIGVVYSIQQIRTPSADNFFKVIFVLSDNVMLLSVFPAFYNLYDSRRAIKLIIMTSFSSYVWSFLALLYGGPRPYWVSEKVSGINCENGYGNPCGETFLGTVLLCTVAIEFFHERKLAYKSVAYTLTLLFLGLLSFSGLYLGEHFPHQLFLSLCYAFVYVTLCFAFDKKLLTFVMKSCFYYNRNRKNTVFWFIATLMMLLAIITIFDLVDNNRLVNIKWIKNATQNCHFKYQIGGAPSFYRSAWIFYNLGVVMGTMHTSKYLSQFWWHVDFWKRWVRTVVSVGLSLGIYFLFQLLETYDTTTDFTFHYVFPYFIIAYLYSGVLPVIFAKAKLALNVKPLVDSENELRSLLTL